MENKYRWKQGQIVKRQMPKLEDMVYADDRYVVFRNDLSKFGNQTFGLEMIDLGLRALELDPKQTSVFNTPKERRNIITGLLNRLKAFFK